MPEFSKIVVKVGSNVLTKDNGFLNTERIEHVVDQICELKKKGVQVVLVSSGAVAAGRKDVNISDDEDTISLRQIYSSVGQTRLMHEYYAAFKKHDFSCAQILLSKEDFRDRRHYRNVQNCFSSLGRNGIVPIVNENDAVSITELMFTDNDELASLITSMTNSDALVILTNVDGVYDKHPKNASAKLIEKIDHDERVKVGEETSSMGRGGMKEKLKAAQKLAKLGADVLITNGNQENSLSNIIMEGEKFKGTHVISTDEQSSEVVRWIAHADPVFFSEIVLKDDLSTLFLKNKKDNIFTHQIVEVVGEFEKDDVVKITDVKGNKLGVARVSLSSDDFTFEDEKVLIEIKHIFLNIEKWSHLNRY